MWDAVVAACRIPDLRTEAGTGYVRQAGALSQDDKALIDDATRKLAAARERRARLVAAVANGVFKADDRDVEKELADADQDAEVWELELARYSRRVDDRNVRALEREEAEDFARKVRLEGLSFLEKRDLVRALVKRVWLDRDGNITIEAALPALERVKICSTKPHRAG